MYRRSNQSPFAKTKNRSLHTQIDQKQTPTRAHTIHHEQKLKVLVKFKPQHNQDDNGQQVKYLNEHQIEIKTALKNKVYKFDYVFNGTQNWQELFQIGCRDLIDQVFVQTYDQTQSNHGLIFVYGNTGTGKTYSMGLLNTIKQNSNGIVPDSIRYLFNMKKRKCYEHYAISVSFGQVYMDDVYDLLDLQTQTKLAVRQDTKTKQHYVENQMSIQVRSPEQAFQILNIGLQKRRVAEQRMNKRSSRGHGLITINIDPGNGQKSGRLCFIDLAGCERLKDSDSKGTTLSEALHINSSLSTLQTLLMNISLQNIRNYRASKLTRLLQPYIEHGKIHLFVTATKDSVNAVQFAKRCKGIRFMERDLRQSTTPIRRSAVNEKNASKLSRELEQLIQYKKQAGEREKKLMNCIETLIHSIKKLSRQLQNCLKTQHFPSKYSFAQILNNSDIEKAVNEKIQCYEQKEQILVQKFMQQLAMSIKPEFYNEQNIRIQKISEVSKISQDHSQDILQTIQGLTALAEYRNIYKKQFFTSQLKLHLLQTKCKKFEDGIHQLTRYMNTSDKRVLRKLKDLGISLGDNTENQSSVRNKQLHKSDRQSEKSVLTQPVNSITNRNEEPPKHILESSPFHRSTRRSAIFIDEI